MFGGDANSDGMCELDKNMVQRAFRKVGMLDYLEKELPDEELKRSIKKCYSALQWKLYVYFKHLFYDELELYKHEQYLLGRYVQLSGYTFKQRMDNFPEIADKIFKEWAMHLGIDHLYARSLGEDLAEIEGWIIVDGSGRSVYERFNTVLRLLK